jgi:hypothetical protein
MDISLAVMVDRIPRPKWKVIVEKAKTLPEL